MHERTDPREAFDLADWEYYLNDTDYFNEQPELEGELAELYQELGGEG